MKLEELRKFAQAVQGLQGEQVHQKMQMLITEMGLDPNNLYQELEMSSPYVDTHRDISYSNAHLHLHSHTFYELLYCTSTCGAEYLVGSERYRLQKGDLVFVPPGVSHRPLLPEKMDTPYQRYVLWLSPEFMEQYAKLFSYPFTDKQTRAGMLRLNDGKWQTIGELFRAGVQESETHADGWEAAVVGNTITLLTQIKRATDDRSARELQAEKPDLLDRIMAYVEKNYASPIGIDDLAKKFFVSSSTVSHLFKQKLGVSFYRYVTQRRLIAAKTLIEKGRRLEEVASQTGFSDYSGFYRSFKKEYGISPRQYRTLQETESPIVG